MSIPVVGGHAGVTILPLLSQVGRPRSLRAVRVHARTGLQWGWARLGRPAAAPTPACLRAPSALGFLGRAFTEPPFPACAPARSASRRSAWTLLAPSSSWPASRCAPGGPSARLLARPLAGRAARSHGRGRVSSGPHAGPCRLRRPRASYPAPIPSASGLDARHQTRTPCVSPGRWHRGRAGQGRRRQRDAQHGLRRRALRRSVPARDLRRGRRRRVRVCRVEPDKPAVFRGAGAAGAQRRGGAAAAGPYERA